MYAQKAKAEIRELTLKKRDALTAEQRIDKSLTAAELASPHVAFAPGAVISGFFPIKSEIDDSNDGAVIASIFPNAEITVARPSCLV